MPVQPLDKLVELNQAVVVGVHVRHARRQIVRGEAKAGNLIVQPLEFVLVQRARPVATSKL